MELIRELPELTSNDQGSFGVRVVGARQHDGSWHGWLEFVPARPGHGTSHRTGVETHQRERAQLERWASGLTRIYAEGAFARARAVGHEPSPADLLVSLQELVEALDRRLPQLERIGESQIAADAQRLRAGALQRIAMLLEASPQPVAR